MNKKLTLVLSLLLGLNATATERSEYEMHKIALGELFGSVTRSAFTPEIEKVETGKTYRTLYERQS